jgi:16S rRNA G527 N7-methylase RsmG
MFPWLPVYLIEVKRKKIMFLERLIQELGLVQVTIVPMDWRTFLRKTDLPIELFCARASLPVSELVRMFKPSCVYKYKRLVYWAAYNWQPLKHERCLLKREWPYVVGGRKRKLVLFVGESHEDVD